jgi:hypothetical protein
MLRIFIVVVATLIIVGVGVMFVVPAMRTTSAVLGTGSLVIMLFVAIVWYRSSRR